MELKTIVLAVDDSDESLAACKFASDLAAQTGAEIVLLHCYRPVPRVLGKPNFENMAGRLAAHAETILEPYRTVLTGNKVPFRALAIPGRRAQVIADTAKGEKAQLIVMGTRGRTDLEGLILGSVTSQVLQIAPCPVTVVR